MEPYNTLFLTDSYKISHHLQYPPETTRVFSYFESRGGKWDKTLFFGLQIILKKYLAGAVVTQQMIDEADEFFQDHFGTNIFNRAGWELIVTRHGGKLPVEIRAVAEGSLVPVRNVLFTVENTDPELAWLTNYLETLLVQVWYPLTVATNSWACKRVIRDYLDQTAEDPAAGLEFRLHDFGFRGVSSVESAGIGGAAHLVSFRGTDTLAGIVAARRFYGAKMAGNSIPATEHSTMTTWGRAGERAAVEHVLTNIPAGGLAIVVDSYDIWNMLENTIGDQVKQLVESRNTDGGGFLVVRPDSGDPREVLARVFSILGDKFGSRENSKGYRVLPDCVRVIQGDGISFETIGPILESLRAAGWSAENLTFGSGGALLQRLDRDTQRCAYKCSMAEVGGEWREVFKVRWMQCTGHKIQVQCITETVAGPGDGPRQEEQAGAAGAGAGGRGLGHGAGGGARGAGGSAGHRLPRRRDAAGVDLGRGHGQGGLALTLCCIYKIFYFSTHYPNTIQ